MLSIIILNVNMLRVTIMKFIHLVGIMLNVILMSVLSMKFIMLTSFC